MNDYKLVPVELLKNWHERINTIAVEMAFNVADEMESMLDTTPAVQGEPVGRVKTVGGYPDESEHTVEWLCKYRDLKDGDLLYAAPQPDVQVESWRHDSEDLEALHNNLDDAGTPRHDSSGIEYSAWGRVIQYAKAADPKAEQLVKALEECASSLAWNCFGECRTIHDGPIMPASYALEMALKALAVHRKGGDQT